MTDELIERLRDCANGVGDFKTDKGDFGLCDEAAATIEAQAARIEELEAKVRFGDRLAAWADLQWCPHEETYRGGILWEICCSCGAKWADDEGGRPDDAGKQPQVLADWFATPSPTDPVRDAAGEAEFTKWFVKNYPGPDTIIHDPHWHAPRVFRAAQFAIGQSEKAAIRRAEGGQG